MRKRKTVKKDEDSEGSEAAGEPEEFQDSGEDWTPDPVMCSLCPLYCIITNKQ